MGLGGGWNQSPVSRQDEQQAFALIDSALEQGITLFDHADIYTFGKAETVFGRYLNAFPQQREQLLLQSKCGIKLATEQQPGYYDLSQQAILAAVDGILSRLQTDYLDILLLHRPDPLLEPAEIAAAFTQLLQQGKVRHFGVSNMAWPQLQLLQHYLPVPLRVNQLEMSLQRHHFIEETLLTGMAEGASRHFGYGTVEYCQQQDMQIQSWGSLAQGHYSQAQPNESAAEQQTRLLVSRLAADYQVAPEAIVLAWLLRHPAQIQPVIGTSKPERLKAALQAERVRLSREHWYQLYIAARGVPLP
jgi:hypothetical protein